MPEWTGKTRGGISGYKTFVFIIKHLGISFAYFVLRFVVIWFLFFAPRAVKYSYYYFNKRLGFSWIKSTFYIYRNFYRLGQVLIDKVSFLSGMTKRFTFDFEGEEHLRRMAENGGGVLIGVHAGNWEMAGNLLKRLGTRINIVMFANEHEQIRNFLSDIYQEQEVGFIVIKDDFEHLFEISSALRNKEIVAIHGDRFMPGSGTLSKNFLGKAARFPTGPFMIPIKFNAPVSFVTSMKETSRHYHFYATQPETYTASTKPAEKKAALNTILDNYISIIEKTIKKYPDQWFNFYDFWEIDKNTG